MPLVRQAPLRFSVHVDAGYLYASLATLITGLSNRAAVIVDEPALIKGLISIARADTPETLLRVLWYDAGRDGLPDGRQRTIGMIDNVKLRMGRISISGEQKGVDLRLGLDLMSMDSTRAVDVAYVISGDDDLTEAVTDAQDLGLQIKVIAVPGADGSPQSVAANLRLAADSTLTIPLDLIRKTVTQVSRPATEQLAKTDGPPGASSWSRKVPGDSPGTGCADGDLQLLQYDGQRDGGCHHRPGPGNHQRRRPSHLSGLGANRHRSATKRPRTVQTLDTARRRPRPLRMVSDRLPQGDNDHGIGDSQRDRAVGDHDHHGRCLSGSRPRLLARLTFSMKAVPILGPAEVSRIEVSKHRRFPRPRGAVSMRGPPTNRRKSAISDSRSLNSAS